MEITELQKDLAATFRWTARLNMHEGVANHFSACVPGSTTDFYVNKAGIHFSQIKASDLILVTKENINDLKNEPNLIDPTAINIHGTIHQKVPHAKCIFHVHSKYATALSTLKDPIMKPIDQNTMIFYNRVSVFNEFGGLGFEDESIKMANALGNKQHILLANHGIITTGETIAEGFNYLYYFEKAAETYLTALSTLKDPVMKPIDQNTMIFYNRVSVFNEFGGLGFEDESIKMANALGNKQHMLLANHGIITTGETIAEGFNYLYYFERAAETYLTALSTNKELNIVSDDVAEKTAQETANYPIDLAKLHLQQIRLILDKEEPEYKN